MKTIAIQHKLVREIQANLLKEAHNHKCHGSLAAEADCIDQATRLDDVRRSLDILRMLRSAQVELSKVQL